MPIIANLKNIGASDISANKAFRSNKLFISLSSELSYKTMEESRILLVTQKMITLPVLYQTRL